MPPRSSNHLTIVAIAERLSVNTQTVRRWIAAGDLHVHRLDRSLRISEEDLAAFLSQRRR